jgi:hypothetical protein
VATKRPLRGLDGGCTGAKMSRQVVSTHALTKFGICHVGFHLHVIDYLRVAHLSTHLSNEYIYRCAKLNCYWGLSTVCCVDQEAEVRQVESRVLDRSLFLWLCEVSDFIQLP